MALEILILVGVLLALGVSIALFLRKQERADIAPLQDGLVKLQSDMAGRIVQASGETKQLVAEKFADEFQKISERLNTQLDRGRQDQEARLLKMADGMEKRLEEIREKVDRRLLAIGDLVQEKLDKTIQDGHQQSEKVVEHLRKAELQLQNLNTVGTSINELNSLLKLPHLRGSFGEMTLESLLADFLPAGTYEVQTGATGDRRPDAIVKFPKSYLPIDSKFPREQVLPLFESNDPAQIESARQELARVVKEQAKQIHDKYVHPEEGSMDMALMFLPSETLYFEVIRNIKLWEQLSKLKVFPVSPNTLAVTLKSIAIAHDYYEMAQGVQQTIEDIRKARNHFEHFENRFDEVGERLRKAQEAFDTAQTNLSRYTSSVTRLTGETPAALPLSDGKN
ncbi:MAG: DNA recombination protein RmuC [Elusimicrobia bacterium]|nr:DNA recombination protein RmuC [Elusimicrobiota bacterium]